MSRETEKILKNGLRGKALLYIEKLKKENIEHTQSLLMVDIGNHSINIVLYATTMVIEYMTVNIFLIEFWRI